MAIAAHTHVMQLMQYRASLPLTHTTTQVSGPAIQLASSVRQAPCQPQPAHSHPKLTQLIPSLLDPPRLLSCLAAVQRMSGTLPMGGTLPPGNPLSSTMMGRTLGGTMLSQTGSLTPTSQGPSKGHTRSMDTGD